MILIITSCINPQITKGLGAKNPKVRFNAVIEGLSYMLETRIFDKIVICDNSNYDFSKNELQGLVKKWEGVELELLSFLGNSDMVKIRGKGYGECEIMQYVLENSKLLKDETHFLKITGKLYVTNIHDIISKIHKGENYMNIIPLKKFGAIDSRFIYMDKRSYQQILSYLFVHIDDRKMLWYEICLRDALKAFNISFKQWPVFPIIRGLSGTRGIDPFKVDCLFKWSVFLSRLGFYNSKFGQITTYFLLKASILFKK